MDNEKIKVGDKFIIEITGTNKEQCFVRYTNRYGHGSVTLYEEFIRGLERYKEPKPDMEHGWMLAMKICELKPVVRESIYGYRDARDVMRMFSAEEAEAVMRKYLDDKYGETKGLTKRVCDMVYKSGRDVTEEQVRKFINGLDWRDNE